MLQIYTERITARIEYTFKLIFDGIYKIPYKLISGDEAVKPEQPCVSYTADKPQKGLFFKRYALLTKSGIERQEIDVNIWNELPVFFMHNDKHSVLPFDAIAVIFYLVTCYEEYLPDPDTDKHGRRKIENSLAYKFGFHHKPMVNILAKLVVEKITEKYPELTFKQDNYHFTPTYDIDMAFAHLAKGFVRTLGGYTKLLAKLRFGEILNRTSTLLGLKDDPFQNFDMQFKMHKKYKLKPVYFVNLGNLSRFDKNVSYKNKKLRKLLKEVSKHAEMGIHPSYYTGENPEKIEIEKNRLEDIIGKEVTRSRQHFVKLQFAETYRNLINVGIQEDYTMGYPSQAGFRAGICTPFNFYNLKDEVETSLKVFPFVFMDTAFLYYLKMDNEEIKQYLRLMINEVKDLNGHLMGIWHNYALSNCRDRVASYQEIINLAVSQPK